MLTVCGYPKVKKEVCQDRSSRCSIKQLSNRFHYVTVVSDSFLGSIVELAYVVPSIPVNEPNCQVALIGDHSPKDFERPCGLDRALNNQSVGGGFKKDAWELTMSLGSRR